MNDASVYRDSIARGSKTFNFAAKFFGAEKARDAAMLYHWCRGCDDTIDELTGEEQMRGLNQLRQSTEQALNGHGNDAPSRALATLATKYRIPAHYPNELIEGMAMDVAFQPPRNFKEAELYCYRVAGVVGLMMAHIMGISDERALRSACDLGIAMQLTNISRDVMADYAMGRCYLPQELLQKHGLDVNNYAQAESREALARVVGELLDKADEYYASGQSGARYLSLRSSFVILIARFTYARIGNKVRARGAKAWDRRQFTNGAEKLLCLAQATIEWLKQSFDRPAWNPCPIQHVWRMP